MAAALGLLQQLAQQTDAAHLLRQVSHILRKTLALLQQLAQEIDATHHLRQVSFVYLDC